ncbi:hypothetical protein HanPSC8_Chr04g0177851 [Helianthus annuus]|nr:hypothetical protein HanPSC8_Chr04g0177851 [Helianthus annuus]
MNEFWFRGSPAHKFLMSLRANERVPPQDGYDSDWQRLSVVVSIFFEARSDRPSLVLANSIRFSKDLSNVEQFAATKKR